MTNPRSPLAQRVRRRLGAGQSRPQPPPAPPSGGHSFDAGPRFEAQLGLVSAALRELGALDRRREAELRALRERLAILDALQQFALAERLAPALRRLDVLIEEAAHLLQPPPEPPPMATLYERMRAQAHPAPAPASREQLFRWASTLVEVRAQLSELVAE